MGPCSVDGCDGTATCRGWCSKHYARWQRHGDPLTVVQAHGGDIDERFMSKVSIGTTGCWLWTAYVSPGGYAKFGEGGRGGAVVLAHRWSYARWNGPIPAGWTVDHLCHNADLACRGGVTCVHRRCVNPAHLGLAATVAENLSRSPNAQQHRTHCPLGHAYDEANTYVRKGRNCRKCHVIKQTDLNRRKRAARRRREA